MTRRALAALLVVPLLMAQANTIAPAPPVPATTKPDPLTASPAAITLDPAKDDQAKDIALTIQVPAADIGGAVTFGTITDLPGGLSVAASPLGSPAIDRSADDGAATGRVVQRVRLTFAKIPRQMEALTVSLPVRYGKFERTVDLTVSGGNQTPANASLSLQAPSDTRWSTGVAIPVTVTAKGAPAPDISLAVGPFTDTAAKTSLPTNFCLAAQPAGPCDAATSLAQNQSKALFLIENGGKGGEPGSYAGSIRLLAANGLDATQTITLSVTSIGWQLLGLLALVVGVILSLFLTIVFPYWHDRDLALRPFLQLSDRLEVAAHVRGRLKCPHIADWSRKVGAVLREAWLVDNGKIGGTWPSANGATPDAAIAKAHLDAETPFVLAIERLSSEAHAHPDKVDDLDAIALQVPFPPANIDAAVATALGTAGTQRFTDPPTPPSLAVIAHREQVQNVIFWAITSLISIGLGYVMLISNNPAFGSIMDVLAAFLWALGLSTASSKIADMTTGSVRTTLRPATA